MKSGLNKMSACWFAAALIASPCAMAQQQQGLTPTSIRIGTFGALTGPGYLYGKLAMNGIDVVFDQVNAAGGINGRKLELIREDDRCDPAGAIGAAQKLIYQEQVFALIGGGCSNATFAARDVIEKAEIPFLVVASVHDGITTPPARTIFSTALTSTIESKAQVKYAIDSGAKKIAVVSMRKLVGPRPLYAAAGRTEIKGNYARRRRRNVSRCQ